MLVAPIAQHRLTSLVDRVEREQVARAPRPRTERRRHEHPPVKRAGDLLDARRVGRRGPADHLRHGECQRGRAVEDGADSPAVRATATSVWIGFQMRAQLRVHVRGLGRDRTARSSAARRKAAALVGPGASTAARIPASVATPR